MVELVGQRDVADHPAEVEHGAGPEQQPEVAGLPQWRGVDSQPPQTVPQVLHGRNGRRRPDPAATGLMPGAARVARVTSPAPARALDVVVFGATGFVGRLVARHLAASAPPTLRIGLAGRSADRLAAVRDGLGPTAAAWPLLTADVDDPVSLEQMAAATRVVASTVGPYARYGEPVVAACAAAGTHYADLTGEVLFVRRTIARFHDLAVSTRRADRALVRLRLGALGPRRPARARAGAGRRPGPAGGHHARGHRPARRRQRRHGRLDAAAAGGGPARPGAAPGAGRPLRAEPRPDGRAGPRPPARRRRGEPRRRPRRVGRAVRHGVVQHAHRPAQQRADRLVLRAAVPLPGGDGVPGRVHRAAVGVRRDRRAGGADGGPAVRPDAGAAGPGAARPRRGAGREDPGRGPVPGRGAGHDGHRRVVHRGGGRVRRPGLRGDRGDAG